MSTDNDGVEDEKSNGYRAKTFVPLHIKPPQRGLLSDEDNQNQVDGSHNASNDKMSSFFGFGKLDSPSLKFQRLAQERDVFSRTIPSCTNHTLRESFRRVFSRKIDWGSLQNMGKEWIKNPMNMVLFIWIICVAVSGAILFLVMTGYKRSDRPAIGVAITISVAIGAPAVAGVYTVVSPLGKDYDMASDEEAQLKKDNPESSSGPSQKRVESFERRFSFASRNEARTSQTSPKWSGGIFDFWEDISLAYLSLFCSFCVFGWNMERLGFGNMYVHIATFLLFCLAPFWIFNLAAINIDNETVREALGITGIFLCVFGLLYGGFWRIQMRKRFNLPPSNLCCGNPAVTDCALWLCCCWCSLAQEVRTGNSYDIVEDKFYKKTEAASISLSPLPREGENLSFQSSPSPPFRNSSQSPSPSRFRKEYHSPTRQLSMVEEGSSRGNDATLEPPVPSCIHRDAS